MIDPDTGLVNESPIRDPPRLYLWSDNVLCATVLKDWDSVIYNQLVNKVIAIKTRYSKTCKMPGTLICSTDVINRVGMHTSFAHNSDHQISNTNYWYSNYDGSTSFSKDTPYSNIQFFRAIYYFKKGDRTTAKYHWNRAISYWDGKGFADDTFVNGPNIGEYELYKYALWRIAKNITHFSDSITPPCAIAAMNQDPVDFSVYTHYTASNVTGYVSNPSNPVTRVSSTNTETAAFCLIANFSSTQI